MIFTQEQINEIRQRLSVSGVKDTQFPTAVLPLTGEEFLAITQYGENKKVPIKKFHENVTAIYQKTYVVDEIFNEDYEGWENRQEIPVEEAKSIFGDYSDMQEALSGEICFEYWSEKVMVVATSTSSSQVLLFAHFREFTGEVWLTYSQGELTNCTTVYYATVRKSEINELREQISSFEGLLFPTVNPTFTAPSSTIALRDENAPVLEMGVQGPSTSDFTTSFDAGAINLNGVKQNNRAGALDEDNSFIYIEGDATDVLTESPYEFNIGNNTFTYRAYYATGPQPKDNKGNNYSTPLAAGYVDSKAVTVNGTYPWYASTAAATSDNPVVKQALVAWNSTAGSMSTGQFTLQPSGTLSQVFKLPRQLKILQMLNVASGAMDTIGTSDYTETTEIINIGGTDVTYYVYTYKGSTRGEVTLLAKF